MTHILLAEITDSDGINAVSTYLGYPKLSSEESRIKLQELINSKTDDIFVAKHDGIIVGWLHLFLAFRLASPSFFEIGGLVVDPSYRGKGVGRSLVKYASDSCGETLRVRCNEKRKETHRFYEAVGFSSKKAQLVFEKRQDNR